MGAVVLSDQALGGCQMELGNGFVYGLVYSTARSAAKMTEASIGADALANRALETG